ncbi:hypothetical protein [Maritalea sp. S77]|uniref:hypothetical protein n=1 Tax=Maritalea sp. S77 TaxID=3415125 RepID=UPI003C7C456A
MKDHELFYQRLLQEAQKRAVDRFNRHLKSPDERKVWRGLTIGTITDEAIDIADNEWHEYYEDEGWCGFSISWQRLSYKFEPIPSHFSTAVWQEIGDEKILQGMAYGKFNKSKSALYVNFVERSFAPTYFKGGILLPILACAEEYALLVEAKEVRINEPLDASIYERYGYKAPDGDKRAKYLAKEL